MRKPGWIFLAGGLILLTAVSLYEYHRQNQQSLPERGDVLAMMPADASAVFFADLTVLRSAAFVVQLYSRAPQPEPDEDYAQFLRDTGFHYERDLDHLAVALKKVGQDTTFFAVADGRIDRLKISALANNSGTAERRDGREIFLVPVSGRTKKIYFTFLSNDRIALTDRADLVQALSAKKRRDDSAEWRSRFERLAGAPIFLVIRHDAAPGAALSAQAPGGFRSPQLSALFPRRPPTSSRIY